MKKNAFTLVELLGVISILGLIILIALPTVEKNIKNSKQKLYDSQISNIESGIKNWVTDNLFYLPSKENEMVTLSLYQLKQGGYVEKDIMNPLNDELFPNDMLVTITRKNNSFRYDILTDTGTPNSTNEINLNSPILILIGSPLMYVEVYNTYTDPGVTALDSEGNIIAPSNVVTTISGDGTSIDTNDVGNYTIKYQVTDPDNEYTTTINRTVIVNDRTKPNLVVPSNITLTFADVSSFNARTGATANDNYDGNLTSEIEITGNLSILPGTYYLTYKVTDSSGNVATGKRTIIVNPAPLYADASGASVPELTTGMIPVKWNGTNWIKANIYQKWYDYDAKEWANAVTVTSAKRVTHSNAAVGTVIPMSDINTMWVWIPRYKYAIPAGTGARQINIVFESKTTTKSTGNAIDTNYRTHPAFTFGTKEVSGIWVGKFETTGTIGSPTILPNTSSLRNQTVKAMYDSSRAMQNNATYGFSTDGNIHMAKDSEWGMISYLSNSRYGKNSEIWINNSSTFITGCAGSSVNAASYSGCQNQYHTATGVNASTTGNIYGVYDITGGANEYVMGMYRPTDATAVTDSSGFGATTTTGTLPTSEYWDRYTTTTATTACSGGICYGRAFSETSGWYGEFADFVDAAGPWSGRGGDYFTPVNTGAFFFDDGASGASAFASFRLVQMKIPPVSGDTTPPVITIIGNNPIYFHVCMLNYVDPGATATDDVDGNLTSQIQKVEDVYGTHKVTYTVTDAAGNTTTAIRNIDYVSAPCE